MITIRKKSKEPSLSAKMLTLYNWVVSQMNNEKKVARMKIVATSYNKKSEVVAEKEIWVGRTMTLSGDAKAAAFVKQRKKETHEDGRNYPGSY